MKRDSVLPVIIICYVCVIIYINNLIRAVSATILLVRREVALNRSIERARVK